MRISDWSSDVCSSDLPLVGNEDFHGAFARLYMGNQCIGQVVDVDDHFFDAPSFQSIKRVIEQRLSGDFHQWLGASGSQEPHALAKTCGHQQVRLYWPPVDHDLSLSAGAVWRFSAGIFA